MLVGALALCLARPAAGQVTFVRPRITDRVDETRLVTLRGNTHSLARAQFDQGAAPPDLPMDRVQLVLQRSPEQEAALKDLLEQQQVSGSPNYRKWLTPDQFGRQFGPADADIQVLTSWLGSHGFQSIKISKGRTVIEFSGTASQVEGALHTPIHRYVVNGASYWANANDPQIPAALAPVVAGVLSLHNFPIRPASVLSGRTGTVTTKPGAKPQINLTNSNGQPEHDLAPADVDVIYNIGAGMTGSGATIGVVARSNINMQDVTDFRMLFGAANPVNVVLNGPDPGDLGDGDEDEAVLDATWPGAIAPAAKVDLVVSEDTNTTAGVDLSEIYIVDNDLADVLTESFSICEAVFGAQLSGAAQFYGLMAEQAAAQGISDLVASGDAGPAGCDDPNAPLASGTVSVNLIAATPFNVAVGGTMFNENGNPSTYWNPANGINDESAKMYIPEDVWNESSTTNGLWSSGGGPSAIFTPKPLWQSGVTGIPNDGARDLPDVSLSAADHDAYVLCLGGSCPANVRFISGTSASTQVMGGIMALVVQKMGRVGLPNYVLYKLAGRETLASCNASNVPPALPPSGSCVFNDVTVGNTDIPGEMGFPAGPGYDEATGLGSVNVSNLVNEFGTAIVNGSTTTLSLSPLTVTHGQSVNVDITVAPSVAGTGTPTGDVSLIANSATGQGADGFTLDASGSVAMTTSLLPGGTYNVTAHYGGDANFLPSDSPPVSVTVNREPSLTTLAIISGNSVVNSVAAGSSYVLCVGVTSSTGAACNPSNPNVGENSCNPNAVGGPTCPTGTVTLTDTFNGNTSQLDGGMFTLNSEGFFEDQKIDQNPGLAVGTHTITATYNGDNSFLPGASTMIVVTVTNTPFITLSPTAGQMVEVDILSPGLSGSTPITVSGVNSFSGAVNLTCAVTPANLSDPPTCGFSSNPLNITAAMASQQSMLMVNTTKMTALFKPESRRQGPNWLVLSEVATAIVCFSLLGLAMPKRRGLVPLVAVLLAVIALGTSCGSSGNGGGGGGGNPGTAIGQYTVTVTATPQGAAAQQTTIFFNVR